MIREESSSPLKSEVVVHGHSDLLVGAQIPFGGLDGGVAEQELDLLQIAAILPTQLCTGRGHLEKGKFMYAKGRWRWF
jgi:hypothetical protein